MPIPVGSPQQDEDRKAYCPQRMNYRGMQRYSDPKKKPQYCVTFDFVLFMDGRYNMTVTSVDEVQCDSSGKPIALPAYGTQLWA